MQIGKHPMITKPERTWNKCPSSWEQLIYQTSRFGGMFLWKCFRRCVGVFARSLLHEPLRGHVLPAPDGRCVAWGSLSRDSQGSGDWVMCPHSSCLSSSVPTRPLRGAVLWPPESQLPVDRIRASCHLPGGLAHSLDRVQCLLSPGGAEET